MLNRAVQASASDRVADHHIFMGAAHFVVLDKKSDLSECERILSVAAQHGVGSHFEIDF